MYNKHELVMIPSRNASDLILFSDTDIVKYGEGEQRNKYAENSPQHLYVLSDEELKKDDWFLHVDSTLPPNKITKHMLQIIKDGVVILNIKKIIATTDKSLTTNISRPLGVTRELPHIPDSFVNIFVDEYNKQNIIKQVSVEYAEKYHCNACGNNQYTNRDCNICLSTNVSEYSQLVVNTDNNIVVKPVKTNWNKEELVKTIYDVLQATGVEIKAEMKFINSNRSYIEFDGGDLKKWIEKNL